MAENDHDLIYTNTLEFEHVSCCCCYCCFCIRIVCGFLWYLNGSPCFNLFLGITHFKHPNNPVIRTKKDFYSEQTIHSLVLLPVFLYLYCCFRFWVIVVIGLEQYKSNLRRINSWEEYKEPLEKTIDTGRHHNKMLVYMAIENVQPSTTIDFYIFG